MEPVTAYLNRRVSGILIPVFLFVSAGFFSCSKGEPEEEPDALKISERIDSVVISTVNYPLYYFTERIAGEAGRVEFPFSGQGDPAYAKPTDEQITAIQNADLILLNGAGYAKWLRYVSLPASKTVNTSRAFKDRYIHLEGTKTHSHGPEGKHTHGDIDFNTWLDPQLATLQARSIAKALTEQIPEESDFFEMNWNALQRDLEKLDEALTDIDGRKPMIASHPVYNYLARRYNWNLKSLHWEPDLIPADREWQKLQRMLTSHPATFMIWESRPRQEIVERMQELGLGVVVFEPCGNIPQTGDYVSVMHSNIEALKAKLESD